MGERTVAYLDTNIFLHFQPFDQVPWNRQLRTDEVHLRVAATVVAELTRHKDGHAIEHVRQRAQKSLSKIRLGLRGEGELVGADSLACDTEPCRLDLASLGLDPSVQDDCILAAVIEYRDAHPGERVVLVTDDAGFAVRAYTRGVETFELPENYRVPRQKDARDTKIQELSTELDKVRRGLPRLELSFMDASDRLEFSIPPVPVPSIDEARQYTAGAIAPHYPQQDVTRWREFVEEAKRAGLPQGGEALFQTVGTLGELWSQNSNIKLQRYFEQCAHFLVLQQRHLEMRSRTVELRLLLRNTGAVPATDINLTLRFPAGIRILTGRLPPVPAAPRPPGNNPVAVRAVPQPAPRKHITEITFRRKLQLGPVVDLRYHLARLNHNISEPVLGLYVQFSSFLTAAAFTIEWEAAAENIPDAATGVLHVAPRKPAARRVARRILPKGDPPA